MQNVVIKPASEAWPDSYIAVNDVLDKSGWFGIAFIDNISNLCIIVAIIGLFLFAFMRILEGIHAVTLSTFNAKKLLAIERQANLFGSRNILLLFSLAISAFIFVNHNTTKELLNNEYALGTRFLLILLAVTLYFMARYIIFKCVDWVNRKSVFKYVNRFYYTHTIMGILLLTIGFMIVMVFPSIDQKYISTYVISVISLTLILYFIRGYQIIISNGFSHFFWILYLCTLEILPTLVILHLILS